MKMACVLIILLGLWGGLDPLALATAQASRHLVSKPKGQQTQPLTACDLKPQRELKAGHGGSSL